jgi:iron(III) transport system permease protein
VTATHIFDMPVKRVRTFSFRDPLLYVHLAVIAILCLLIVYPAVLLLNMSVRDEAGNLTSDWFAMAYSVPRNYVAIWNTVLISVGTSALAMITGTYLAWVTVRTDMPGRRMVEIASIVPFISTPFIGALSWVLLASPQTGLLNQLWRYFGFESALFNIYSLGGIIFVSALYEMPFVFLMVAGALRSMDPALEEASLSSGAGLWRTTSRVTLPLVLPAILGSGLLVFVLTAEQFGVPAVLGTPSRIRVLTTGIVEAQASYPARQGLAAALSVTLLILAMAGLWLQRRLLAGKSFTTVGGKGSHPRRIQLGKLRGLVMLPCVLYLALAVVLPLAVIFISSIRTIWTAEFHLDQFTLQNYSWVLFDYPITQRAIFNSLMLSIVGATVTILLCAVISFLSIRTRLPGRKLLDYLAILPLGFPGVVIAIGLMDAWITPPFVLYGTVWIILVAYIARYLPIGVRSTSATLLQIHPELEESSLSSGANWFQTFRHVTLPLLKPGIFAGWILLFVAFMRELSASVLLYSPRNEVLSVAIYDLFQQGEFRALSALTCVQIALSIVMLLLAKRLSGMDQASHG